MSKFEYDRRRLTSITEIQGAALVLNTPPRQALSVDDMRRMFPETSIPEAPRNGTLIHTEDYSDPNVPYVCMLCSRLPQNQTDVLPIHPVHHVRFGCL